MDIGLEPIQLRCAIQQLASIEHRAQLGLEGIARLLGETTRAQGQHAIAVLVTYLQGRRVEAIVAVHRLAPHIVELQVPAFIGQPCTAQLHVTAQLAFGVLMVQRQHQVEVDRSGAGNAEVVQGFTVAGLQRTLPQHRQQMGTVVNGTGLHMQLGLAEIGDACLHAGDLDPAQVATPLELETIGDEVDIGVHLAHQRPMLVEADAAIVDMTTSFKAPVVARERPVVQITHRQADTVAQIAIDQCRIQPVHCSLAHVRAHPEALGCRHRHIIQRRGQVDPRARAIALEPHAATHVGRIVLALHPQCRGAYLPTCTLAPAHQLPGQVQLVQHAKPGRPIEAHQVFWGQCQRERIGITLEVPTQTTDTRAATDGGKTGVQQFATGAHRAVTAAGDTDIGKPQRRLRRVQPATQAGLERIAECHYLQQRPHINLLALQREVLAVGQQQAIEHLLAAGAGDAQPRRVQPPATGNGAPTRAQLQLVETGLRHVLAAGQRGATQHHLVQLTLGGDRHHPLVLQAHPGMQFTLSLAGLHPGHPQQRRPGHQIGRLG